MTGFSLDLNDAFSGFAAATPADGCTQCGICLSVCPTFNQSQDVEQSPMGRIRLMRSLEKGETEGLALEKLESCLGCYACEAICPSRVNYGGMLDQAMVRLRKLRPMPIITRLMLWLSQRPSLITLSIRLAAVFEFFGIRRLLRGSGLTGLLGLARADALLGHVGYPESQLYNRVRTDRPDRNVALFTGCFTSVLEQEVQQAAIDVLNALGIAVVIPKSQGCCGALHRHNGDSAKAAQLAERNLEAFNNSNAATIVTTSSGCGAALQDYPQWLEADGNAFLQPVMDISHYLAQLLATRKVIFKPQALKVAVHTPCTLRQGEGQADSLTELLKKIPGLELHHLSGAPACCGAGGSQMLTHTDMADALRDEVVAEAAELNPDVLLSANLGCALHLQSGLKQAGLDIPLRHPVQLLSQALTVEFVSVRPR